MTPIVVCSLARANFYEQLASLFETQGEGFCNLTLILLIVHCIALFTELLPRVINKTLAVTYKHLGLLIDIFYHGYDRTLCTCKDSGSLIIQI